MKWIIIICVLLFFISETREGFSSVQGRSPIKPLDKSKLKMIAPVATKKPFIKVFENISGTPRMANKLEQIPDNIKQRAKKFVAELKDLYGQADLIEVTRYSQNSIELWVSLDTHGYFQMEIELDPFSKITQINLFDTVKNDFGNVKGSNEFTDFFFKIKNVLGLMYPFKTSNYKISV